MYLPEDGVRRLFREPGGAVSRGVVYVRYDPAVVVAQDPQKTRLEEDSTIHDTEDAPGASTATKSPRPLRAWGADARRGNGAPVGGDSHAVWGAGCFPLMFATPILNRYGPPVITRVRF